ncbi:MAG: ABC transporter ATP-binding protein, partial [Hydrogenoanaerobacterium sp.]
IRDIKDKFNLTVFMIEHHMDLVMEISDRIYVLDFGETIAKGTPAEIQNNKRVIDAYLGVQDDA